MKPILYRCIVFPVLHLKVWSIRLISSAVFYILSCKPTEVTLGTWTPDVLKDKILNCSTRSYVCMLWSMTLWKTLFLFLRTHFPIYEISTFPCSYANVSMFLRTATIHSREDSGITSAWVSYVEVFQYIHFSIHLVGQLYFVRFSCSK